MQKAIREVEKKYLKLDEPVLTNVTPFLFRFLILSKEKGTSNKLNWKIWTNTWLKIRKKRQTTISKSKRFLTIGKNAWSLHLSSRIMLVLRIQLCWRVLKTSMLLMRKELIISQLSSLLERMRSLKIKSWLKNSTLMTRVSQQSAKHQQLNGSAKTSL